MRREADTVFMAACGPAEEDESMACTAGASSCAMQASATKSATPPATGGVYWSCAASGGVGEQRLRNRKSQKKWRKWRTYQKDTEKRKT